MDVLECLREARAAGEDFQVGCDRAGAPGSGPSRGASRRRRQRPLPRDGDQRPRLGRPRGQPRALLRLPGPLVRAEAPPDDRIPAPLQDPERLRPGELPLPGLTAPQVSVDGEVRLGTSAVRRKAAGSESGPSAGQQRFPVPSPGPGRSRSRRAPPPPRGPALRASPASGRGSPPPPQDTSSCPAETRAAQADRRRSPLTRT